MPMGSAMARDVVVGNGDTVAGATPEHRSDPHGVAPEPFTLVIFGASGDLTRRKLIPAVYSLFRGGLLPERFSVVGFARREMSDDAFRDEMRQGVAAFSRNGLCDDECWRRFAASLHYHVGDYGDPASYRALHDRLEAMAAERGGPHNCLFYLATPPAVFRAAIDQLRRAGLARPTDDDGPWSHIIVEKPFGRDLGSARALNAHIRTSFDESQIFRIDHYLGKETVQNLLVLRFANAIFEPIWNHKYVDHVQITVGETVGVEQRGAYYDQAGALRDMVQNHMMHLLALVAMEAPSTMDADAVRDEKVKVLHALRPALCDCMPGGIVRAQYTAGNVGGRHLPGYRGTDGVAPDSTTETYTALKTFVDNWRWSGVPFYLRTGKAMPVRATEISIHFGAVPQVLFNAAPFGPMAPNVLALRIQPNEGISLQFQVKVPGAGLRIQPFEMAFGYADAFGAEPPDAYERLLLDAALGDPTLFTRSDEVEAAWAFLTPILDACAKCPVSELPAYAAGSWGPKEADDLIEADGRRWTLVHPPTELPAPQRGGRRERRTPR